MQVADCLETREDALAVERLRRFIEERTPWRGETQDEAGAFVDDILDRVESDNPHLPSPKETLQHFVICRSLRTPVLLLLN